MAAISTSEANDLPDGAFAYIEPGGTKDQDGKTTPRSLRHFPVHDAAHVRNALARASSSPFGDKAMAKIRTMAKKFGVHIGESSMSRDYERREVRITSQFRDLDRPIEMRDLGSDGRWIGGYATVFIPRESKNLGGFKERVMPGFFNEVQSRGWKNVDDGTGVVCRYNHDSNMVLGTTDADTLRLGPDRIGLDYMVKPPESRADIRELVERRDIRYSSFAFRCHPGGDEWDWRDGLALRTLHSGDLIDVAPVLTPGYGDTTSMLRAFDAALYSIADYVQAEVEEVRAFAADDDLRKFFVRSDRPTLPAAGPRRGLFGPAALTTILMRRRDQWDEEG
jgi:HK97 family phage prohead protease